MTVGMTRGRQLRSLLTRWLLPPFAPFVLEPIATVRDRHSFEQAIAADAVAEVREAVSRIARAY